MREIKFRAWHKDWQAMYQVRKWEFTPDGAVHLITDRYPSTGITEADHCEMMQYTGLKDKNGKEIYEGDIVIGQEKEAGFPPYDSTEPRVIEFRNGCWCFDAGRDDDGDWIRFGFWTYSNEGKNQLTQLEVIGNIHENPELLKQGGK